MAGCCFCPAVPARRGGGGSGTGATGGTGPTGATGATGATGLPGTGDCVTFQGCWNTAVQEIFVDMSVPFSPLPGGTFSPAPDSFLGPCGDPPVESGCIFVSPGFTHATDPPSIDPWALEPLGSCQFELGFNCDFIGSICWQFCCQGQCSLVPACASG